MPKPLMRSDSYGPADGGGNLAEAKAPKNPPRPNSTINYFNKIGAIHPVRKAGLGCRGVIINRSAESYRFQIIVGLDDLYQPIFGGAVTAIGIWMVAFHELLETRFHLL